MVVRSIALAFAIAGAAFADGGWEPSGGGFVSPATESLDMDGYDLLDTGNVTVRDGGNVGSAGDYLEFNDTANQIRLNGSTLYYLGPSAGSARLNTYTAVTKYGFASDDFATIGDATYGASKLYMSGSSEIEFDGGTDSLDYDAASGQFRFNGSTTNYLDLDSNTIRANTIYGGSTLQTGVQVIPVSDGGATNGSTSAGWEYLALDGDTVSATPSAGNLLIYSDASENLTVKHSSGATTVLTAPLPGLDEWVQVQLKDTEVCQADSPLGASPAPLGSATTDPADLAMLFGDTTDECRTFQLDIPEDATHVTFGFETSPETAPDQGSMACRSTCQVRYEVYCRDDGDDAWSSNVDAILIDVADLGGTENDESAAIALSTLSCSADGFARFALARDPDDASDDLDDHHEVKGLKVMWTAP